GCRMRSHGAGRDAACSRNAPVRSMRIQPRGRGTRPPERSLTTVARREAIGHGGTPFRTMKPILAIIVVLGLLPAAFAATPERPPRAEEILARYIEASGGRDALRKITTRIMRGTVEVASLGATGEFEVKAKAP